MSAKSPVAEKANLHPRNAHRQGYDFAQLVKTLPALGAFVKLNAYQNPSIDFSDPDAVKALNKALLKQFYGVDGWDIPAGYLCPPVPGRADYLHYAADLLALGHHGVVPLGAAVKVLDIGTGANGIYPMIGNSVYGWQFVGADIDPKAISAFNGVIAKNKGLKDQVTCRLQTRPADIFKGVIGPEEFFALTVCNPPFHASKEEARAGTRRKWSNLKQTNLQREDLNFGGMSNELFCEGGEAGFIRRMVEQSVWFAKNVQWFTTLVAKKETLPGVYAALKKAAAATVKTIPMAQGQKVSRMVAWTFTK
jgi:23S rRNA (adenine1618-N6)-methyltransferase